MNSTLSDYFLIRRLLCGAIAAGILLVVSVSADADPTPGEIMPEVHYGPDDQWSYACYLPRAYREDRAWPILYCFSPGGNGRQFVEGFAEICEQHGWIVVGSNDSRNGLLQEDAVEAFWEETHERFAIDDERVYVSGFSGGSRVATWFGGEHEAVGHIAMGGVYDQKDLTIPLAEMAYVLLCGERCFNREEMEIARDALRQRDSPVMFNMYEGGHVLPPKNLTNAAVTWLDELADARQ